MFGDDFLVGAVDAALRAYRVDLAVSGPEEVAKRITDGVKNRTRTLIMTRQGKLAVLLSKFVPAFVDKMVYKTFAKEKDSLLK